jgi:hypothetical protein
LQARRKAELELLLMDDDAIRDGDVLKAVNTEKEDRKQVCTSSTPCGCPFDNEEPHKASVLLSITPLVLSLMPVCEPPHKSASHFLFSGFRIIG